MSRYIVRGNQFVGTIN